MPTPFAAAADFVLAHEGGFVNHPADPGGATNYGLSLRFLRQVGVDVDQDGDVDVEDVRLLTREQAVDLLRVHFWTPGGYDALPDAVAVKLLDLAYNTGPRQAHRLLQRALRAAGRELVDDGVLGPKTRAAAQQVAPEVTRAALCSEAAGFYRLLAEQRALLGVFLAGWLRRAYA